MAAVIISSWVCVAKQYHKNYNRVMDKLTEKKRVSLIWILAGLALGVIFIVVSVPSAAQNLSNSERNYPSFIQNVFNFIQQNYVDEVDGQKLFEGAMKGMMDSLDDPHSAFLPVRGYED
jgi:carboxyl-terminal processing protease